MNPAQLALNTVSVSINDFAADLPAIREAGFTRIEFYLGQVKAWFSKGGSADALRRLLDANELRCIGGFETILPAFADGEARRNGMQAIAENARLLQALGGVTLVVGVDAPAGRSVIAKEDVPRVAEALDSAADEAGKSGVSVMMECNWGPVKSLLAGAAIIDCCAAKNVGLLFDPAHFHCTSMKREHLDHAMVAHIKHVHLNDMPLVPPEWADCNSDRVLPGQGKLDLADLVDRLESAGYSGDFGVEMFSQEIWDLPVHEAARILYQSAASLCREK